MSRVQIKKIKRAYVLNLFSYICRKFNIKQEKSYEKDYSNVFRGSLYACIVPDKTECDR